MCGLFISRVFVYKQSIYTDSMDLVSVTLRAYPPQFNIPDIRRRKSINIKMMMMMWGLMPSDVGLTSASKCLFLHCLNVPQFTTVTVKPRKSISYKTFSSVFKYFMVDFALKLGSAQLLML